MTPPILGRRETVGQTVVLTGDKEVMEPLAAGQFVRAEKVSVVKVTEKNREVSKGAILVAVRRALGVYKTDPSKGPVVSFAAESVDVSASVRKD